MFLCGVRLVPAAKESRTRRSHFRHREEPNEWTSGLKTRRGRARNSSLEKAIQSRTSEKKSREISRPLFYAIRERAPLKKPRAPCQIDMISKENEWTAVEQPSGHRRRRSTGRPSNILNNVKVKRNEGVFSQIYNSSSHGLISIWGHVGRISLGCRGGRECTYRLFRERVLIVDIVFRLYRRRPDHWFLPIFRALVSRNAFAHAYSATKG